MVPFLSLRILYVLCEFKDRDIDWIVEAGSKREPVAGTCLIRAGEHADALYIVLQGSFEVCSEGGTELARLGPGEFFGELSFLDSRCAVASVTAEEDAVVLALPHRRLLAKFRGDSGFAARFYRAIGMVLADRLRQANRHITGDEGERLDESTEAAEEIAPDFLDGVNLGARRFQLILDRVANSTHDSVGD